MEREEIGPAGMVNVQAADTAETWAAKVSKFPAGATVVVQTLRSVSGSANGKCLGRGDDGKMGSRGKDDGGGIGRAGTVKVRAVDSAEAWAAEVSKFRAGAAVEVQTLGSASGSAEGEGVGWGEDDADRGGEEGEEEEGGEVGGLPGGGQGTGKRGQASGVPQGSQGVGGEVAGAGRWSGLEKGLLNKGLEIFGLNR